MTRGYCQRRRAESVAFEVGLAADRPLSDAGYGMTRMISENLGGSRLFSEVDVVGRATRESLGMGQRCQRGFLGISIIECYTDLGPMSPKMEMPVK